jgi:hypothetical protein
LGLLRYADRRLAASLLEQGLGLQSFRDWSLWLVDHQGEASALFLRLLIAE